MFNKIKKFFKIKPLPSMITPTPAPPSLSTKEFKPSLTGRTPMYTSRPAAHVSAHRSLSDTTPYNSNVSQDTNNALMTYLVVDALTTSSVTSYNSCSSASSSDYSSSSSSCDSSSSSNSSDY